MLERCYEVSVRGVIPEELLDEVRSGLIEVQAMTILIGRVRDQAELQGVLRRVHSLGLELLEVRQVADASGGRTPDPASTRAHDSD